MRRQRDKAIIVAEVIDFLYSVLEPFTLRNTITISKDTKRIKSKRLSSEIRMVFPTLTHKEEARDILMKANILQLNVKY